MALPKSLLTNTPMLEWQAICKAWRKKRGYYAAGITYKNKFHVLWRLMDGSSSSKTTELISIDGGVEWWARITRSSLTGMQSPSINSTVSLLSGGVTSATNSGDATLTMRVLMHCLFWTKSAARQKIAPWLCHHCGQGWLKQKSQWSLEAIITVDWIQQNC